MTTTILHAVALSDTSKALQDLHQQLLRFQANKLGFAGSPLQLFDRAAKDAAFEWLKPLRSMIVAIDERRADDEPMSDADQKALTDQCRALLDAPFGPFRANLNAAFQSDPETIGAVGAARRSLAALN